MTYKLITVWLEGDRPLLLNRATEETLTGGGGARLNTPGAQENSREICERAVYRLPDRQLAVPGAAFARLLREAGGAHKARKSRKSLKYIVPAAVLVLDDLCGLYEKNRKVSVSDFEVDSRPVTIPATKGRVMRHRARVNEWACCVSLRVNDDILDEKTVRQLLVEGMQQIGIGDFRPEKGGSFGVGAVVSWKVESQAPTQRVRLRAVE